METILVIDDEEINLEVLETFLSDENYEVLTATDGNNGWHVLEEQNQIDLILLDRMMPNMDGMEFMDKIKHSNYRDIPIIMQTAASTPEQIREGVNSGVFHYLTKPFDPEQLNAVVQCALNEARKRSEILEDLHEHSTSLELLERGEFLFRTQHEARSIATALAKSYPDPDNVVLGIMELALNAVEHGNLNIGHEEKTDLVTNGQWDEEIEKRLTMPEFKDRKVSVLFEREPNLIRLTITDQGEGFNWQHYVHSNDIEIAKPNGRGIVMSKILSFDTLVYNDKGNQVVTEVGLPTN